MDNYIQEPFLRSNSHDDNVHLSDHLLLQSPDLFGAHVPKTLWYGCSIFDLMALDIVDDLLTEVFVGVGHPD